MNYETYQAVNTLLKERINTLEQERLEARIQAKTCYSQCDKNDNSEESKVAYSDLNRWKNRLRATNQKLRKWRAVHAEFRDDMALAQDDALSWVRLASDEGKSMLASVMNTLTRPFRNDKPF